MMVGDIFFNAHKTVSKVGTSKTIMFILNPFYKFLLGSCHWTSELIVIISNEDFFKHIKVGMLLVVDLVSQLNAGLVKTLERLSIHGITVVIKDHEVPALVVCWLQVPKEIIILLHWKRCLHLHKHFFLFLCRLRILRPIVDQRVFQLHFVYVN